MNSGIETREAYKQLTPEARNLRRLLPLRGKRHRVQRPQIAESVRLLTFT
jgi:hypothetical protein